MAKKTKRAAKRPAKKNAKRRPVKKNATRKKTIKRAAVKRVVRRPLKKNSAKRKTKRATLNPSGFRNLTSSTGWMPAAAVRIVKGRHGKPDQVLVKRAKRK